MRRHLCGLAVGVEFRILGGNSDDFVVGLATVDHGHQADSAGVDDGERHHGFLAEHENIERIIVFRQSLRNKAVVGGIVNGGVENAIKLDQAACFIEFVFHARSKRDLDHAVEFLRKFVAGSYVVPGMDHRSFRTTTILTDDSFGLSVLAISKTPASIHGCRHLRCGV